MLYNMQWIAQELLQQGTMEPNPYSTFYNCYKAVIK